MKEAALVGMQKLGFFAVCRRHFRGAARILTYHGVDSCEDALINFDGLQIPPALFRKHMECLASRFTVWPLERVASALSSGEALPPNVVAITFDDGYRNNLEVAAPILREFEFPATFFLATGYVDGRNSPWWYRLRVALANVDEIEVAFPRGSRWVLRDHGMKAAALVPLEQEIITLPRVARDQFVEAIVERCGTTRAAGPYPIMNRDEVRTLVEMGFDLGPHTIHHISMRHETGETVRSEILASTEWVREIADKGPAAIAYPYGCIPDADQAFVPYLQEAGLRYGLTTVARMNRPGGNPYRLGRWDVNASRIGPRFAMLVAGVPELVRRFRSQG